VICALGAGWSANGAGSSRIGVARHEADELARPATARRVADQWAVEDGHVSARGRSMPEALNAADCEFGEVSKDGIIALSKCGLSARRSDSARWFFGQGAAAVLEPPMPRRGASRGDGWVAKGRNELPDGVGSVGVEPVPDDGGDRREVAELVWLAAALGVTRITADQRLRSCQSLRSLTVMSTVTLESCCH